MAESILDTTKLSCSIELDDNSYDAELMMYINSVFFMLHSLGVGPEEGFLVNDSTKTWTEFTTDAVQLQTLPTYMGMRVRLIFDPPATGPATQAMERLIEQMEWRLNIYAEGVKWDIAVQTYLQSMESM